MSSLAISALLATGIRIYYILGSIRAVTCRGALRLMGFPPALMGFSSTMISYPSWIADLFQPPTVKLNAPKLIPIAVLAQL